MQAKDNTTYAVIINHQVSYLFTKEEMPEWNENDIVVLELSDEQKEWVEVGMLYDAVTQSIIQPNLQEYKAKRIEYINAMFDFEMNSLIEVIPFDERLSWNIQEAEAKSYRQTNNIANCPFLQVLAQMRKEKFADLVTKVLAKSDSFNIKLAKLIGNRQNLQKQIESATTYKQVLAIEYVSPLQGQ